jgi:hypothetical protein
MGCAGRVISGDLEGARAVISQVCGARAVTMRMIRRKAKGNGSMSRIARKTLVSLVVVGASVFGSAGTAAADDHGRGSDSRYSYTAYPFCGQYHKWFAYLPGDLCGDGKGFKKHDSYSDSGYDDKGYVGKSHDDNGFKHDDSGFKHDDGYGHDDHGYVGKSHDDNGHAGKSHDDGSYGHDDGSYGHDDGSYAHDSSCGGDSNCGCSGDHAHDDNGHKDDGHGDQDHKDGDNQTHNAQS